MSGFGGGRKRGACMRMGGRELNIEWDYDVLVLKKH